MQRHELKEILAELSRAEKTELLQLVVRDLGDALPGIETSPSVCGGEPRVVRTTNYTKLPRQYRFQIQFGNEDIIF